MTIYEIIVILFMSSLILFMESLKLKMSKKSILSSINSKFSLSWLGVQFQTFKPPYAHVWFNPLIWSKTWPKMISLNQKKKTQTKMHRKPLHNQSSSFQIVFTQKIIKHCVCINTKLMRHQRFQSKYYFRIILTEITNK